jgi:hypothetical protein
MALATAERKERVYSYSIRPACITMNRERITAVYAPAFENDSQGNRYLDLTGTADLCGPLADCSSQILRELLEQAGMRSAAAAGNKLVCKAASRAIHIF